MDRANNVCDVESKPADLETPEESVHHQWVPATSMEHTLRHSPARNQPTQQEETSENQKKLLFTPRLCQRSERKDRAHLLPPRRQGDLQVITHSEAIPDEGKDHDAREENRGDLQGPLCRLKLRVQDCISSHRLKPSRHNCIIFYYHPHPLCT